MTQFSNAGDRRTNVDEIFGSLHHDIVTLKIMPGTKISELEIANQFDVSRQPVRDAFARLGNLGLLLVRPQKATEVRKFSDPEIAHARFVRTAIEVEVLKAAIQNWPTLDASDIRENVAQQVVAVETKNTDRFHELDYDFHKLLCVASGSALVFETIAESKSKLDRLCVLSLEEPAEMAVLLEDHQSIIAALDENQPNALEAAIRKHLARLDSVVAKVRRENAEYFE